MLGAERGLAVKSLGFQGLEARVPGFRAYSRLWAFWVLGFTVDGYGWQGWQGPSRLSGATFETYFVRSSCKGP